MAHLMGEQNLRHQREARKTVPSAAAAAATNGSEIGISFFANQDLRRRSW